MIERSKCCLFDILTNSLEFIISFKKYVFYVSYQPVTTTWQVCNALLIVMSECVTLIFNYVLNQSLLGQTPILRNFGGIVGSHEDKNSKLPKTKSISYDITN